MSRFQIFCKGCLVVYRVVVLVLLAGVTYGLYDVSQGMKQSLKMSRSIDSQLYGIPSSYDIESAVERAVPSTSSIESAVQDAVRNAVPSTYGIEDKLGEILDKVESIYYHVL